VIPALDGGATIAGTIAAVSDEADEVVVSDGGSTDATCAIAAGLGARSIVAARGRGEQIAAGVAASTGDWLLLLHADTRLDPGWREEASWFMGARSDRAAYFRFALDSADIRARRIEQLVAWRCRRFGLPYGDQGLLISRCLLARLGGVRPLPLMEDVDLVRRIGRTRLVALDSRAVTSAARWERQGWRRRSARNLLCLTLYFAGVPPRVLRRLYG
jgi:rSAM/selenodomain-associated transferase 2